MGSVEAAIKSMARLNRDAAEVLHEIEKTAQHDPPIHAVTDVTGFGLLGHAREMASGSAVSMRIDHAKVPLLPGAREAAHGGFLAGGLKSNREFVGSCVGFAANIGDDFRALLFDPQTSGGLLIAIAPERAAALCAELQRRQIPAAQIGEVVFKRSPLIEIT